MIVTFSGDICVSNPIPDFRISPIVQSFFDKADYRFACFEVPVLKNKGTIPFNKVGPVLSQHGDIDKIDGLFSHVTIANNHIMDYGITGLQNTLDYLIKKSIKYGGAGVNYEEAYKPIIIEKEGVKVAVLCLAESQFGCCRYKEEPRAGYAWIFNRDVYQLIQHFKKECDYVVCFVHAGLEMYDYPLPEWRSCYYSLIDCGCDLVVASHPHVIQGKEYYKGKSIYYSLGNFFFNNHFDDGRWTNSLSLSVTFIKEGLSVNEFFTTFSDAGIMPAGLQIYNHFSDLSSVLLKEKYPTYIEFVNREAVLCWKKYYEGYFSYPIIAKSRNIVIKIFKRLFMKYIYESLKPTVSRTMLYHNIMVDTHRFVIARAISVLNKTY